MLAIDRSLGKAMSINLVKSVSNPEMSMPEKFIHDGGLTLLPELSNVDDTMRILSRLDVSKIPYLALKNGLFVKMNSGLPAFIAILKQNNQKLSFYILDLLNAFNQAKLEHGSNDLKNVIDDMHINNNLTHFLVAELLRLEEIANNELKTNKYSSIVEIIVNHLLRSNAVAETSKENNKFVVEDEESIKDKVAASKKLMKEKQDKVKAKGEEKPDRVALAAEKPPNIIIDDDEKGVPDISFQSQSIETDNARRRIEIGRMFETWVRKPTESPTTFIQKLVECSTASKQAVQDPNRFVELYSSAQVHNLQLAIQHHCQTIKRPIFYVDSPEDLICSAPYMARLGDIGEVQDGPSGRLHEFLSKEYSPDNPPIVLVNYLKFKPDDVIRFNGIVGKINTRNADGTRLPKEAIVIALNNVTKPDSYQGSDLYSMFTSLQECPVSIHDLFATLPDLLIRETPSNITETTKINLFYAEDWKERLLGQWVRNGKQYQYKEGLLQAAINQKKPIELINGLWDNVEFVQFWEQAMLSGRIEHAGDSINVSKNVIFKSPFNNKKRSLNAEQVVERFDDSLQDTLNPSSFAQYFFKYECVEPNLYTRPGIIAANAGKELHVNITRDLNPNQWDELLNECELHHVKLICHRQPLAEKLLFNYEIKSDSLIIQSNDLDVTAKQLGEKNPSIVINITDLESTDILTKIKITSNVSENNKREFDFSLERNALYKALDENKNVILKGQPTERMMDALASFMLERRGKENTGKVFIVCHDASAFAGQTIYSNQVLPENKKYFLAKKFGNELVSTVTDKLAMEEYSKLEARLAYTLRMDGQQLIDNSQAWQGLEDLPNGIKLASFDLSRSEEITSAFTQARRDEVNRVLTYSPYVYLTGITGVGKSTFVEQDLIVDRKDKLYKGDGAIEAWANDVNVGLKYLFIDEANVTSRSWNEFEGLFDDPPGILINGNYIPLSKNHKVVFAGNPLSYGDRTLAPFFERHGNAAVFDVLPQELIYEKMIKPVFSHVSISIEKVASEFLAVYEYVCKASVDEVLISPREVQMMALLTLSHLVQHPEDNAEIVAKHYAAVIGSQLVPAKLRDDFDKKFKASEKISHANFNHQDKYYVTPSRQPVIDLLSDALNLSEWRQKATNLNDVQKFGGLGCIFIEENEAGLDKTELAISFLRDRGYKHVSMTDDDIPEKAFYVMPVSMPPDQKRELLLKAFHQGAKVVIDEINSSPMMERLLNDLLMGKDPDGKRPDKPGFMVVGTQNPVTLGGRREVSKALARRSIKDSLPVYTTEELIQILIHRGIQQADAQLFVELYEMKRKQALSENLKPVPTFNDLLRKTDEYIQHVGAPVYKPEMPFYTKESLKHVLFPPVTSSPESAPSLTPKLS